MGNQVKPELLSPEEVAKLMGDNPGLELKDILKIQSDELSRIKHPSGETAGDVSFPEEVHVFYPWLGTILRCVGEQDLLTIRTNRNRELISADEQKKLRESVVGVAGMSVGSSIAMALVYSGMARTIKIADNDILDTSNLNRLRESLVNIGLPKVDLTARHIYELDPFADVRLYGDGVTAENIDSFFEGLDLIIDEIDDFKMKVMMRKKAKESGVPLLMMTSLGDNILIDIERYDTEPDTRPFNGLLHDDGQEILDNPNIDPSAVRRYSVEVVGAEYIPTKALQSVAQMGKTLVGRPQLYTTIAIDGGLAGFISRHILLGSPIKSGRYFVRFADLVGLEASDLESNDQRQEILQKLMGQ